MPSFRQRLAHIGKALSLERKGFTSYYNMGDVGRGSLFELVVGLGGRMTARRAATLYRQSSAVATAVDMIADEMEQIKPVLLFEDDRMEESHPILDLLEQPNPFEYRQQFIGRIARDWLLNHDSFMAAAGNFNREPIAVYAIDAQCIAEQEGDDRYAELYHVTDGIMAGIYNRRTFGRQRARFLDTNLKELYHIRGHSSRVQQILSDSPLEAIALEARQQILGRHHNLRLLENGGRLSLVAIFKDTLDEPEHQERRQALNEQLGGADNAGKIAVISADDMELEEVGANNKDMDYANLDAMASQAVYLRYKVPLPLVTTVASTFDNMENSVFHFYDRAVCPNYTRVMAGVARFLMPRFGLDPAKVRIWYNPENITALRMRMMEELEKRRSVGVETIDELRTLLPNRDKVDGGDKVLVPSTLVPLDEISLNVGPDGETPEEAAQRVMRESEGNE